MPKTNPFHRLPALVMTMALAASSHCATAQQPSQEEHLRVLNTYCGSCHTVPHPELLPKRSWPSVVDSMVELAEADYGEGFVPEEAIEHLKALYYGNAPEELARLPYIDTPHPEVAFSPTELPGTDTIPQILNIQPTDIGQAEHSFLVSDGGRGQVSLLEGRFDEPPHWRETALADIAVPVAVRVDDFTGNGREDILVADLGELQPNAALSGKVYLLRQEANGEFTRRLLVHQLGRLTDVHLADLTGNGRLDLAIAVFGSGDVGEAFWMEAMPDGSYAKRPLLEVSGALNLTPVDLNGNGRLDLVSLVAQEHEAILAFINGGEGRFERTTLMRAGHPLFGATSLTVADLNQNGRPDLVFTNGDAFDTQTDPKPYHGVQWLENLGELEFAVHDIGRFYGAANVTVGDVNGSGHPDLVVSSWHNHWDDERRQALVWYENDGQQRFTPHPISNDYRGMVPAQLADITGNGRMDILAGVLRMDRVRAYGADGAAAPDDLDERPRMVLFENIAAEGAQ